MTTRTARGVRGGIGESVERIDGVPKTTGEFAYGSDLWTEGTLFGLTLRSPHARARIRSLDVSGALTVPGVYAVLTADDLPGKRTYGTEFPDQPVLAWDVVQYAGEPVALVAAEDLESARAALGRMAVEYEPLDPVVDSYRALDPGAPRLRPWGNVLRHIRIEHGDPDAGADVWVEGYYETGIQDQAPLGPEAGIAVPDGDGGVELHMATQWTHIDLMQLAPCLGLPEERVRVHPAGVGGAFGAREDISIQIHACLLALRTGRPVRMSYGRDESFLGHVHRHPARIWVRTGADRSGRLVVVRSNVLLDGGAYASSSPAVLTSATTFAAGPYEVPNALLEGTVVYTNNPPSGAMRGFGSVQAAFAYEAQMDKLAAALDIDPVELRLANVVGTGSTLPTGQVIRGSAPAREVIERCLDVPLPPDRLVGPGDPVSLPGGAGNVGRGESVRRGVGFAFGFKNVAYSEGFDDDASIAVRLYLAEGGPVLEVHTAAVEVGQGLYTVLRQIGRSELGLENVEIVARDTTVGSAGSTSASRQTLMSGGALHLACGDVRRELASRAGVDPAVLESSPDAVTVEDGELFLEGVRMASLVDLLNEPIEATHTYHHPATTAIDARGQGDVHTMFVFAAERAVVDVDTELGLARVVHVAAAQDVGRAINPGNIEGQIEGATAQGIGLALTEELVLKDGIIGNASFTDYLIPTTLDMPEVSSRIVEDPEPGVPLGIKGAGEQALVVAPAAVAAALRDATALEINRIPARIEDLAGLRGPVAPPGPPPHPDVPGPKSLPYYQHTGD